MKANPSITKKYQKPQLLAKAKEIASYIKSVPVDQIQKVMHVSPSLAQQTKQLIAAWNTNPKKQTPAIDAFRGDIYSGFQAHNLSISDRSYANKHLYILSGLYGILKALDSIYPYRLEMGYKFKKEPFNNMYSYWGSSIASSLPQKGPIINLTANEYAKTVTKFIDKNRIISPKFLTINAKTGKVRQIIVHTKIARGAFANWLIKTRQTDPNNLTTFKNIGYQYNKKLSKPGHPTFVCKEFKGTGLSVKLRP